MPRKSDIRLPAVGGMFYPAEPDLLRQEISGFLEGAGKKSIRGNVLGLIVPHAGYMYSGGTAACGYALLAGAKYKTVVVISPSHRDYFEGIAIYPGTAYRTPLGQIDINQRLREKLVGQSKSIIISDAGHRDEHAIEVQLPFLQHVLPEFSLLPLVIGKQSRENCQELGEALGQVLEGEDALLVASTDLSHYYSEAVARQLDAVMIEDVRRFDFEQLMSDLEGGKTEACGGGPTVAMMGAARKLGATQAEILRYSNSGDVTGDRRSVVGYLCAVLY